jgi:hypothetical protein
MDRSLSETNTAFNVPVFMLPTEMAAEIFVYCIPPTDVHIYGTRPPKKTVLKDVFRAWRGSRHYLHAPHTLANTEHSIFIGVSKLCSLCR